MGYEPMVFDTPLSYPFDRALSSDRRDKPQGVNGRGINVPQAAHGASGFFIFGGVGGASSNPHM